MVTAIAVFAIIMGSGFFVIWTKDILTNPDIDMSVGFFRARDRDSGSIFWLHWLAEYGTGAVLIVAGAGLFLESGWGRPLALLGLGSLVYTSVNSLGWAFAKRERLPYAAPMFVGALGGILSAAWLLVTA